MTWSTVPLGEIIDLEYGSPLKKADRDDSGSVPVAGSNGVTGYHSEPLVKGPGIVVGRKGSAGAVTWFENDFWPIDTTFYVVPKQSTSLRWIYYLLEYMNLGRLAITTGVPGLNRNRVYAVNAPLPEPLEQHRIVELLDWAETLRQQRRTADTLAERVLPALFYQMFGDPATNPMEWETCQLGRVVVDTRYGTSTRANTDGRGIAVLRMNNIDAAGFMDLTDLKHVELDESEAAKYELVPGDLLFNRTNSKELVGKTGLWEGQIEAVPASYLIRVRVDRDEVLPEFIWAWMNMPFIKRHLFNKARRAVGMANINAKELRALPAFLPDRALQEQFVERLQALKQYRTKTEKSKRELDDLFALMLQRAFSGELTAAWREAHMEELLQEMDAQAQR